MQDRQPPHLDNAQVAAAIERALDLKVEQVRHVQTKGYRDIYEAVLANGREVVLKAEVGAPDDEQRLALEAWALERARSAGVPAPLVLGESSSQTALSFSYLVMDKAAGVPLDRADLAPDLQHEALRECGRLLAKLHRVKVSGYGVLNEQHYIETGEVAGRFARWAVPSTLRAEAALNELYGAGALDVEEASGAMHLIEDEAATDVLEASLLHGDFSARHVYVDPATGVVTSIIDFGDRMAGPPLWDLAGAWLWNAYLPGLIENATDYTIEGHDAESGTITPRPRLRTYCLMRLLVLARQHHETGRTADFAGVRQRLDGLLEQAGRL